MTRGAATWLGLAALVAVVWGHGLFLAVAIPSGPSGPVPPAHSRLWENVIGGLGALGIGRDAASIMIGGAAAFVVLACQAGLARGVERLSPVVLLAPLFTALSPRFAEAAMASGEEVLFAALLLAGCYCGFAETHTAGRLPASAVLFGASAGLGLGGLLALAAAFLQRIIFARRFRLAAPVYGFAFIWLAIGLATFGLLRWMSGPWGPGPVSGQPFATGNEAAGLGFLVSRLWDEVNGLAVLPYVLVLVIRWKPKALFFLLTLVGLLLAAWLPVAARAPVAGVGRVLAPAIPLVMLVVAEGMRGIAPALETVGLGERARRALITVVVVALALAQAWPTLARLAPR